MDPQKRERLEKKGWKVGTTADFLELTPEEEAYVELRLALSRRVRAIRQQKKLTQQELAARLGSSQSRMAKLEAGNSSVSLDLLIRSLLALGTSMQELASLIAEIPKGNLLRESSD